MEKSVSRDRNESGSETGVRSRCNRASQMVSACFAAKNGMTQVFESKGIPCQLDRIATAWSPVMCR
jgi:hypothetical protein